MLCHLESATQDAAAIQLGVAKSTLKTRLERGRTLLRNRLVLRGMGPSALLAVAAWPCGNALAGLSTKAVVSAVEAATTIAAGGEATSVVSARVASLAEGVIRHVHYQEPNHNRGTPGLLVDHIHWTVGCRSIDAEPRFEGEIYAATTIAFAAARMKLIFQNEPLCGNLWSVQGHEIWWRRPLPNL